MGKKKFDLSEDDDFDNYYFENDYVPEIDEDSEDDLVEELEDNEDIDEYLDNIEKEKPE